MLYTAQVKKFKVILYLTTGFLFISIVSSLDILNILSYFGLVLYMW